MSLRVLETHPIHMYHEKKKKKTTLDIEICYATHKLCKRRKNHAFSDPCPSLHDRDPSRVLHSTLIQWLQFNEHVNTEFDDHTKLVRVKGVDL